MNSLAAFAFNDDVAEKQMHGDVDRTDALTHDNRLIIPDDFAFVIGHFVIINGQFVRENGIPIAGNPACYKCMSHSGICILGAKILKIYDICK